jgi:hypothetical protein
VHYLFIFWLFCNIYSVVKIISSSSSFFFQLNFSSFTKMAKDRTIGVALDFSKSSKNALKWALDNLADKGDNIYIIHISHDSLDESRNQLWAQSGSRKYHYFCN